MDEIGLKPYHPYNIILTTQSKKDARGNISTCESFDLRFSGIFILKGSLQLVKYWFKVFRHLFFKRKSPTFGSRKLGFLEVFISFDVNVFICLLVYFFQVIPPYP